MKFYWVLLPKAKRHAMLQVPDNKTRSRDMTTRKLSVQHQPRILIPRRPSQILSGARLNETAGSNRTADTRDSQQWLHYLPSRIPRRKLSHHMSLFQPFYPPTPNWTTHRSSLKFDMMNQHRCISGVPEREVNWDFRDTAYLSSYVVTKRFSQL